MAKRVLFEPISLRDVTLKNRVVVAPMHQYSAVKGFATDWHLMNAGRYAAGGAGLVIMESTKVARNGCGTVGDTGLWHDKFIPALARCAAFIKAQGALAGIQLGHSGRKARRSVPWEGRTPLKGDCPGVDHGERWELIAPSALAHDAKYESPREMTHADIAEIVEAWSQGARRALAA